MAENESVAAVAEKPKREFKRYGISDKEFATVWNASESPAQVAEKLSNDTRAIPVSFVNSRAAQMRARGWVTLKSFRGDGVGGRPARTSDPVAEQAELVAASRNVQQGTAEYEQIKAEIREKITLAEKAKADAKAKRDAAKAAKETQQPA